MELRLRRKSVHGHCKRNPSYVRLYQLDVWMRIVRDGCMRSRSFVPSSVTDRASMDGGNLAEVATVL